MALRMTRAGLRARRFFAAAQNDKGWAQNDKAAAQNDKAGLRMTGLLCKCLLLLSIVGTDRDNKI